LVKEGWKGIIVEPVKEYLDKLPKVHEIVYENVAIGGAGKPDIKDFYYLSEETVRKHGLPHWATGIGSFTNTHKDVVTNKWEHLLTKQAVPVISFQELLDKYDLKKIDYLKIDAEGFDCEILKQVNLDDVEKITFEHKHAPKKDLDIIVNKLKKDFTLVYDGPNIHATKKKNCNKEKVAVALTVYNRAELIKETFDGLKKQTLKDFHIYLCWDGSTDNILDVVESYRKDLNITLCDYGVTTSVGSAKNKAVSEALKHNHQYVQVMDSDDIPLPMMLEEQSKRLDRGDVDWAVCWGRTFGANSGYIHSEIRSLEEQCNKNYLHSWVMAKVEVFEKENFRLDLNGIDDWDWWIRVFKAGFKGDIVEKELHMYRIHQGRVTETTGSMSLFSDLRKKVRALNNIEEKKEAPPSIDKRDLYEYD
jgi:FkbM family methyltransferase